MCRNALMVDGKSVGCVVALGRKDQSRARKLLRGQQTLFHLAWLCFSGLMGQIATPLSHPWDQGVPLTLGPRVSVSPGSGGSRELREGGGPGPCSLPRPWLWGRTERRISGRFISLKVMGGASVLYPSGTPGWQLESHDI